MNNYDWIKVGICTAVGSYSRMNGTTDDSHLSKILICMGIDNKELEMLKPMLLESNYELCLEVLRYGQITT